MPIPQNITREHALKAIERIENEGIPPKRNEKVWAVLHNSKQYPCKLIISWANLYANGTELSPHKSVFTTKLAQNYLKKIGFIIISIK